MIFPHSFSSVLRRFVFLSTLGLVAAAVSVRASGGEVLAFTQFKAEGKEVVLAPGKDARTGKPTPPLWKSAGALPVVIDLALPAAGTLVHGVRYQPRRGLEMEFPTAYEIELSGDGVRYERVAAGRWNPDTLDKTATFAPRAGAFVRLTIREAYNPPKIYGARPLIALTGLEVLTGPAPAPDRATLARELAKLLKSGRDFLAAKHVSAKVAVRLESLVGEIAALDSALATPEDVDRVRALLSGELRRLSQIGKLAEFRPGEIWLDTDGHPIDAHGGGIWRDPSSGIYYWYGEAKPSPNASMSRTDVVGVGCYSSRDLYNWKNEGLVLRAQPDAPEHDLHPSNVLERPKVVFNRKTGKYVMWMHIDNGTYRWARAGVAVADKPTGPFTYIRSVRPLDNESRDMTLYADDDGAAYLVYSSEKNRTLLMSRLTEDYLDFTGQTTRVFPNRAREAPAIFKTDGRYYMISSGLSGWAPNAAEWASAPAITGPWTAMNNPCVGPESEVTFRGQSTYVVQAPNGRWIFMADRWIPRSLKDSRYLWLPIKLDEGGLTIEWQPAWSY